MHLLSLTSIPVGMAEGVLVFSIWFVAWCPVVALLEYASHRWIMHKANRLLDPKLLQLRAHGKHHQGVNHHELVDLPVLNGLRLTAPFLLAVLVWGYVIGPAMGIIAPGLALLTWSFVYSYLWNRMHRAIHDLESNWFRRSGPVYRFYLRHHMQHHLHANANFGTVFPWTDYLFFTYSARAADTIPITIVSPEPAAKVEGLGAVPTVDNMPA